MRSFLRYGDSGPDAAQLIRRLTELGLLNMPEGSDVIGPGVLYAVKTFQARQGDIEVDGIVGPITRSRLWNQTKAEAVELTHWHREFLLAATREKGVHESGYNRGKRVEEYQKTAGIGPGDPWCMAFVYWCALQAARACGIEVPIKKTGACQELYDWAEKHGRLLHFPEDAIPGDIPIMLFGNYRGHVGIIEVRQDQGKWLMIEGNSASAEGPDGVHNVNRRYTQFAGVLRVVIP